MLNSCKPSADALAEHGHSGAVVTDMAGLPVESGAADNGWAVSDDVSISDWDTLFSAVKARLRQSVGLGGLLRPIPPDASIHIKGQVLQCLEALDQLQTTMLHYIDHNRVLEAQLSAARSALARVRDELSRTQAGEHAARHLAAHDELTSLPNRAAFQTHLSTVLNEAAAQGQVFALLYLDLDGFKSINDTHGHAAGDELLRIVAARLAGAVRAEDMVSRIGGDEFACLLWATPPSRKAVSRLASTLFDAVSAPFQIGVLKLTVCPSIGIAMWPADGQTAESLLARADTAMYSAKRRQTGHAYFDQCGRP
jgi:diguanylate cyclase